MNLKKLVGWWLSEVVDGNRKGARVDGFGEYVREITKGRE